MPELSGAFSVRRFEREIQLAASLQQANIVPVLSAGDARGVPFYVMPFVEGLSLRQELEQRGRPSLDRIVGILRDVARALAFAHGRGVVHRDIKPDNILLSGDAAVVTDFGIAKAVAAARDETGRSGASTTTGMAIGTPAYMAPEQIAGGAVDHRADLYAFGCVAYELLAGSPPFSGTMPQQLLAAHLTRAPTPLGERRPECPPDLARLTMRCLAKDPAERPQSAREILEQLDRGVTPASRWSRLTHRLTRRQRTALVALLFVAGLAGGGWLIRERVSGSASTNVPSIAVLPLLNLSGIEAAEYLADGIADGLATALGRIPGVQVISRSLSYRYKGQRTLDARQAGQALSADLLLHGSLQGAGDRLRVSVQLTRTADNREVWSDFYERAPGDVLAIQDGITGAIISALERQLGRPSSGDPALAAVETRDPLAYDLYLRGRFLLQRRGAGVRQAVERFEEVLARDPGFARADASLALALQLLPYFEPVRAADQHRRSVEAAERALGRDSTLAEAHTALAMARQHAFEWPAADSAYRRALALQPNEPDAHIQFGRFLFYTGRFVEARAAFERARELDTYSAVASGWLGHLLHLSGRSTEGLAEIRRGLEIDSTNPPVLVFAAQALGDLGRPAEAAALLDRLWTTFPPWRPVAAGLLARLGEPARARALLQGPDSLLFAGLPLRHTATGLLFAGLGDTVRALDALERATDEGEIWPTYYSLSEPMLDELRSNPRFAALVRRVRLDEQVFRSPTGGRPTIR
jgi:serine/threonine-protein kinase